MNPPHGMRPRPDFPAVPRLRRLDGCIAVGMMTLFNEAGMWLAPPGRNVWIPPRMGHSARYTESSSHIKIIMDLELSALLPQACRTLAAYSLLRELAAEAVSLTPRDEPEKSKLVNRLIICEATKSSQDIALFVHQGRDPRDRAIAGGAGG